MNLLEMLEELGLLDDALWVREDGVHARVKGRTTEGRLRVSYLTGGVWAPGKETWDDRAFLQNFKPQRPHG